MSPGVKMLNIVSFPRVHPTLEESDVEEQAGLLVFFFPSLHQKESFSTMFRTRKQCTRRYKSPGAKARCSSQLNMQHSSGIVKTPWTKNKSLSSSLATKTASLPLCFSLFKQSINQRKEVTERRERERESKGEKGLG